MHPDRGTKPAPQVCAPTGNRSLGLSVYGMMRQPSDTGQGSSFLLGLWNLRLFQGLPSRFPLSTRLTLSLFASLPPGNIRAEVQGQQVSADALRAQSGFAVAWCPSRLPPFHSGRLGSREFFSLCQLSDVFKGLFACFPVSPNI